ncbi:MAG: sigma-70 family RNA polymerase sigma factor [Peptococcaceae bacterium]
MADSKEKQDFAGEFKMYYPILIKQVTFLLGDTSIAEDIVQDTLIKYYYTKKSDITNPKAWLLRVAVNSTYNYLRSEKNRKKREEINISENSCDVEEIVIKNQQIKTVREAIGAIPERERMLILLKYTGYTYSEISQVLGIEASSVGTMLARAKKKFKNALLSLKGDEI